MFEIGRRKADVSSKTRRGLSPYDFGLPSVSDYEATLNKPGSKAAMSWRGMAADYELELELRRSGDSGGWSGKGYIMTSSGVARYTVHTGRHSSIDDANEELIEKVSGYLKRLVADDDIDAARKYNTSSFKPINSEEAGHAVYR